MRTKVPEVVLTAIRHYTGKLLEKIEILQDPNNLWERQRCIKEIEQTKILLKELRDFVGDSSFADRPPEYRKTFMDKYADNEVTEDDVHDEIELWSEAAKNNETTLNLHEWLGMSPQEYNRWIQGDSMAFQILKARGNAKTKYCIDCRRIMDESEDEKDERCFGCSMRFNTDMNVLTTVGVKPSCIDCGQVVLFPDRQGNRCGICWKTM